VRVMAKSPADRYLNYEEFILALTFARSQLLIQQSTGSQSGGSPKAKTSWWRR
jgi:hypothetical protein